MGGGKQHNGVVVRQQLYEKREEKRKEFYFLSRRAAQLFGTSQSCKERERLQIDLVASPRAREAVGAHLIFSSSSLPTWDECAPPLLSSSLYSTSLKTTDQPNQSINQNFTHLHPCLPYRSENSLRPFPRFFKSGTKLAAASYMAENKNTAL